MKILRVSYVWMTFLCLFVTSDNFASLQDHFKPAQGKIGIHTIPNIDFIYMINLDERPEKFQKSEERLKAYGIYPYRFSAVNGWKLSLETINDVGVRYNKNMAKGVMGTYYDPQGNFEPKHELISKPGRNYFCHCMSRGAIGIVLSHLSILNDAYESGFETIWVMEDDIEIVRDPRMLPELIEKLDKLVGKSNWDILFTDQDTRDSKGKYVTCSGTAKRPNFSPKHPDRFKEHRQVNRDFRRIGARYGAYSMIVRRTGMKKLLDFYSKYQIFLPFDMDYCLPDDIKLFTVVQDVVRHVSGNEVISDNGGANYEKSQDKLMLGA